MDEEVRYLVARMRSRFYKLVPAISKEQREKGLQGVKDLPKDHGVIFVHDKTARHPYWMRNTFVELTLIFLDCEANVVDVIHRTDTNSLVNTRPTRPAKYVIEVPYDPDLSEIIGEEIDITLGENIDNE